MASIGAFVASTQDVITFLQYNMRSQIFAKSLPMPLVIGALKRLELLREDPSHKEKLWTIVDALQTGLKDAGFEIGNTQSCVTPVYLNGTIPEATTLIVDLRETYDIFCSMVVYPVVPKGVILLRLIPTAVHTLEDVSYTIDVFSKIREHLKAGKYKSDVISTTI